MAHVSDASAIARVLDGDVDMFGTLVDRYQDGMLAYVRHMGFSEPDARDVLQDAFVRAYRHLGRCGDPDRFEGWLFRIVSNLCRTAGAKAGRRRTERLEPLAPVLESDQPTPAEVAEANWTKRRIRAALDAIPHDQREALVLMYMQGLSVAEIEAVTGASRSAIKMRLMRGREALKEELGAWFSEVDQP